MKKPSVSQLIGLLDKPALLNWANKQGLLGVDINVSRKKAMAEGSSLHRQIEQFYKGTGSFEDDSHRDRFIEFRRDNEILDMEFNIETPYFVGRVDCLLMRDGYKVIADFKKGTSNVVYFEQKLQLVAYGMATGIENFALINVPDFIYRPVILKDINKYEDILKSLSNIWSLKEELK